MSHTTCHLEWRKEGSPYTLPNGPPLAQSRLLRLWTDDMHACIFAWGHLVRDQKEKMMHLVLRRYTREHHRSEPNQTWVSQQRSNRLPGFFHALPSPAERTARRPPPGTEDTSSPGTTSFHMALTSRGGHSGGAGGSSPPTHLRAVEPLWS